MCKSLHFLSIFCLYNVVSYICAWLIGGVHWTDRALSSLLEVWRHVVTWPGRENPRDFWDPYLVSDLETCHYVYFKHESLFGLNQNTNESTLFLDLKMLSASLCQMFLMKDSFNHAMSKSAHIWPVFSHPWFWGKPPYEYTETLMWKRCNVWQLRMTDKTVVTTQCVILICPPAYRMGRLSTWKEV